MNAQDILKRRFGHSEFRPGQKMLIDALVGGSDVLGVMPTGAGKSMCYQIPALMLPGITLVISPLISLMKDQVAALIENGIAAAYINSSLTAAQTRTALRRAAERRYKIIYIAPERLETAEFLEFAIGSPLSLIAVDEAHCVSQWGQDFRPSYLKIIEFLNKLPVRPPVGAFTATATEEVREDIINLLGLRKPLSLTTGFDRPNLYFEVAEPSDKDAWILDYVRKHDGQSGIIYCATRKTVEALCMKLQLNSIPATRYHAGLPDDERRLNQEDFVYDRAPVMVATNAFGMGIDKSNVSYVLHANMPKNLESYYQEAGRAGRDGSRAECVLLFSNKDIVTDRYLILHGEPNDALSPEEQRRVTDLELNRLSRMIEYCRTDGCLREYILRYFGETDTRPCGNCSNCIDAPIRTDITRESRVIVEAVNAICERHPSGMGLALLTRVLCGSHDERIARYGLDKLPQYGALKGTDRALIRQIIEKLASQNILLFTDGKYPVVRPGQKAKDVQNGMTVSIGLRQKEETPEPPPKAPRKKSDEADPALLAALKALRLKLAQTEGVPAFVVFSNATLIDMAARCPQTMEQFLEVSGVGEVKAERYGEAFLAVLHEKPESSEHVPAPSYEPASDEDVSAQTQAPAPNEEPVPATDDPDPGRKPNPTLLTELKALRLTLAQKENVPAFFVFSNAALTEMAVQRPQTMDEFHEIKGVGKVKAERYGEDFIAAINDWLTRAAKTD